MFSRSEFENSIFYPAAGTDVQIMLRLSHLSETIIAPTVSTELTPQKMASVFRAKCDYLNQVYGQTLLELVAVEDLSERTKNLCEFAQDSGVFTQSEKRDYMRVFSAYTESDIQLHKYTFHRKVGDTTREISWFAPSTEGLATLTELSLRTGVSPKVLVTIQSGIMEHPGSPLVRIMERLNINPELWVRGYWPYHVYWAFGNKRREILSNFPPYKVPVQHYGYYNSRLAIDAVENEDCRHYQAVSRVRAFARTKPDLLSSRQLRSRQTEIRSIEIRVASIIDNAKDMDFIFVNQRLKAQFPEQDHERIITWESLSPHADTTLTPLTLQMALKEVEKFQQNHPQAKLAMTPIGFEDETECIESFVNQSNSPLDLTIFLLNAFDYAELLSPISRHKATALKTDVMSLNNAIMV